MRTTRLGRSNLTVSEFCLGTMMFGGKASREDSVRIVRRAVEAGVNFVDTADVYNEGRAEEITGEGLKGPRDRVVLASKVGMKMGEGANDAGVSRYHIIRGVEESLKRLATDRIDKGFEWQLTAAERDEVTAFFPTEVQEEAGGRFPFWRRSLDIVR